MIVKYIYIKYVNVKWFIYFNCKDVLNRRLFLSRKFFLYYRMLSLVYMRFVVLNYYVWFKILYIF